MQHLHQGQAHIFGDNINTDIISPPQYMELSAKEAAPYAMSGVDPGFAASMKPGDIIVAGANFGSGSSRELAPLALKELGVGAVVARFFARIFYRNAVNLGLPVVECEEAGRISKGDTLAIDLENGVIRNLTANESYACSKLPPHILELMQAGGLIDYLRLKLHDKGSALASRRGG